MYYFFLSILIYLPLCAILLSSYFYDLVYYYIGDIKNGHGNLNFVNGFFFIIFFMSIAWLSSLNIVLTTRYL
jgi:hypothetical protein